MPIAWTSLLRGVEQNEGEFSTVRECWVPSQVAQQGPVQWERLRMQEGEGWCRQRDDLPSEKKKKRNKPIATHPAPQQSSSVHTTHTNFQEKNQFCIFAFQRMSRQENSHLASRYTVSGFVPGNLTLSGSFKWLRYSAGYRGWAASWATSGPSSVKLEFRASKILAQKGPYGAGSTLPSAHWTF